MGHALEINTAPKSTADSTVTFPVSGVAPMSRGAASSGARSVVRASQVQADAGTFILDLMGRIERVEGTFSVTYATASGDPLAEIIVARGRIGCVGLSSGQVPLGHYLLRRDPGAASAVRDALVRAKAEGIRLGEALIALGSARSNLVREALLDQIVDGFCAIAEAAPHGLIEAWSALSPRKAPSQLADFAPIEVFRRAIGRAMPKRRDAASGLFDELAERGAPCALFGRQGDVAVLLDTRCDSIASMEEVAQLSWIAREISEVTGTASASPAELIFTRAGKEALMWLATPHQIVLSVGLHRAVASFALSSGFNLLGATSE